ncbi:DUF3071 domain-containing protein [Xylanimonas allomyrinae]|uniref:DUF3071 domain-containing protein n=1 Tax=Xylanimonas allomyrinae TaxID=2509459 RepID=A0A4P6EM95_9MICO|nr:DUF3071 domain-containing protein [Xylanimonas allomyrinae]
MAELELVRVHGDGAHLVLRAPDGTEHALPVTDALRAAIRSVPRAGATSSSPSADTPTEPTLRPRDLQARMRAGATAEELAAQAGLPVEHVRRYEWPVITERDHVIAMVRAHEVQGTGTSAPLGEIADSRLAARGVPADEAVWSARREGAAPWLVEVCFAAGDRERRARWTFDVRGRVVTPLDDEARWLGQPDEPLTPEMRGVPSLAARRGLPPGDPAVSERGGSWGDDETDLLLDDLAGRRGHRPPARAQRPRRRRPPPFPRPAARRRTAGSSRWEPCRCANVRPCATPTRSRSRRRTVRGRAWWISDGGTLAAPVTGRCHRRLDRVRLSRRCARRPRPSLPRRSRGPRRRARRPPTSPPTLPALPRARCPCAARPTPEPVPTAPSVAPPAARRSPTPRARRTPAAHGRGRPLAACRRHGVRDARGAPRCRAGTRSSSGLARTPERPALRRRQGRSSRDSPADAR